MNELDRILDEEGFQHHPDSDEWTYDGPDIHLSVHAPKNADQRSKIVIFAKELGDILFSIDLTSPSAHFTTKYCKSLAESMCIKRGDIEDKKDDCLYMKTDPSFYIQIARQPAGVGSISRFIARATHLLDDPQSDTNALVRTKDLMTAHMSLENERAQISQQMENSCPGPS